MLPIAEMLDTAMLREHVARLADIDRLDRTFAHASDRAGLNKAHGRKAGFWSLVKERG